MQSAESNRTQRHGRPQINSILFATLPSLPMEQTDQDAPTRIKLDPADNSFEIQFCNESAAKPKETTLNGELISIGASIVREWTLLIRRRGEMTCLCVCCMTLTRLTSTMRSPSLNPEASAGDPASTLPINCPFLFLSASRLKPKSSSGDRFTMWQRRGAGASFTSYFDSMGQYNKSITSTLIHAP